jgi:hypothetical protein
MLFTFVDFITQGWLKKKKWISKIYFPIYWIFSFITLSFLYRPLVYNFLDNKFGKRLSFVLIPVYITILVLVSLEYETSNYFKTANYSSNLIASRGNYLDLLTDENDFIDKVAISSKVITTSYINVFVLFDEKLENHVFNFNPGLKPDKDKRGLTTGIIKFDDINWTKQDSLKKEYIKTVNDIYSIKIDTIEFKSEFILSESTNKFLGFESYIKIKDIEEGKHLLKVIRKRITKGDTNSVYAARIPFWYFKN